MPTCSEGQQWLIELLAWWEGQVRPGQLANYWQCTRTYASSLLGEYRKQYPSALSYDAGSKSYRPMDSFLPLQISRQADEYLNWLMGYSQNPGQSLPTYTVQLPLRTITPQLMRPLIQALREGRRVEADYGSITSAERDGRIIVPHHLVKTANRWHIRAWCEQRQDYRDFVLSRFRGTPELLGKSPISSAEDEAWNQMIEIILIPDYRLSSEKREVIEQDYGMESGRLILQSRACMVNYLLQGLNIDPRKLESDPEAQQVMIDNFSDIKQWLFG